MKRIRRNVWSYETLGTEREPCNAASQCSQGRPRCHGKAEAHTARPSGALRSRACWPKRNRELVWQRLKGTEGPSPDSRRAGMRHSPCPSAGTLASRIHVQAAAGCSWRRCWDRRYYRSQAPRTASWQLGTHEPVEL